jgi:mxaC protein
VLLLDRSRSMDQGFVSRDALGSAGRNYYNSISNERGAGRESKSQAARRVLAEFTARRSADRFGMLIFSAQPIRVLDFTGKPEAVQAAIAAADVGRGLTDTDISSALLEGLAFFEGRAYTGSRILLLVSDGGDHIDPDARERLAQQMRLQRVSLYWIYIRSLRSPGLAAEAGTSAVEADTVPEIFLHRFFGSLGIPYRAYEAESREDLQRAIDDVDRLENLPITTLEVVPRRPLAPACFALAALALLLLLAARLLEPLPEPAR